MGVDDVCPEKLTSSVRSREYRTTIPPGDKGGVIGSRPKIAWIKFQGTFKRRRRPVVLPHRFEQEREIPERFSVGAVALVRRTKKLDRNLKLTPHKSDTAKPIERLR